MNGTTLCPHCDTRFKIMEAQLAVHHGMVRCGHCLQAFDARPNFIPDQPNPQLELPILNELTASPIDEARPELNITQPISDLPDTFSDESLSEIRQETDSAQLNERSDNTNLTEDAHDITAEVPAATETIGIEPTATDSPQADAPIEPVEIATSSHHDLPDFSQPEALPIHETPADMTLPLAKTLAEQVVIVEDEHDSAFQATTKKWHWALAALLCLFVLVGQAAYFFRIDLAARLPPLKPALIGYCQLLKCAVPLPQRSELMSIESSDLEADPALENQITLNALLRNRATFSQAFPHLELTLNDTQDKPLARRVFKPADYLPPLESENFGLLPNHELGIKLHLDVTNLEPTGYRLVLFYPNH